MARKCQRRRELSWCLISCRDAWVHREFTNVGSVCWWLASEVRAGATLANGVLWILHGASEDEDEVWWSL
ncbi:unnamed protein product [Blepharisma stoltei]|uniref:Uncharacterized protein n=1 Tax=Blepharisma stoltei TaxID=1481888 RepID=A0AAU9JJB1_9CILI|nr:unnamed protein product [Blepharisma stoltei]